MELIPSDEFHPKQSFNFTPMIDFLFLMLTIFATLAVTRAALFDTDVKLAELNKDPNSQSILTKKENHLIHLSVNADGKYKWLTEFNSYDMENVVAVQNEISKQYEMGAIPQNREETEVLLHIDKKAPWEPIAELIFGIRQTGFQVKPIYEPIESKLRSPS